MAIDGRTLRAQRERAGVPLARIASRLQLTQSRLGRVEAGQLPVTPEIATGYRRVVRDVCVRLTSGDWVRPPGASYEVRLHGKRLPDGAGGIEIVRTGRPEHARYEGWDLTPVLRMCYVRRTS